MATHTNSSLLYAQTAIDPLGVAGTSTLYFVHASAVTTNVTISVVRSTGPMSVVNAVANTVNGVVYTDSYI